MDLTPRSLRLERSKPHRFRPRRQLDVGLVVIVAAAVAVAGWLLLQLWRSTRVHAELEGLVSGTPFTPEDADDLAITIRLPDDNDRFRAHLTLDGVDLLETLDFQDDALEIIPAHLADEDIVESALDEGDHDIVLRVDRPFLPASRFHWTYTVDDTPPLLTVPAALEPVAIATPVTVRGEVEEGSELTLNGEPVEVTDGAFSVRFDHAPTGALTFEAVDQAGNRTTAISGVPVLYPSGSRAVHVSAAGWANDGLRAGVLSLVDRGLIDTVELDLKDEAGVIGYASQVPLARRIGAVKPEFDLAEAVAEIEARGARVIGRLVAFRDPIYAQAAWGAGRTDEVIQSPDGGMLAAYGGFTNYTHERVRAYNLDIAVEAVGLGVKDILWDYMRRPEGAPETMVVPGLGDGTSAESIVEFLGKTHEELRSLGAYQGASVFGIAAASGNSIAQDVPRLARVVDYLAPMIYPSHWGPGQYRVANPVTQPYEITRRSLMHFQEVTEGSGVRILPWIQDFTLYGVTYGPAEVRAQIDAAAELGMNGFLLWNPNVRYTADALTPIP